MFFSALIFVTAAILFAASLVDLKTGEIPEPLSMGLIALILLVALGHTILVWNFTYLGMTVLWGVVALAIAYLLFWLGQWGGGDVKILAGVGCFLGYMEAAGYTWPLGTFINYPLPPLVTYLIDMAVTSTPYVIAYTIILGVLRPTAFVEYGRRLREKTFIIAFALSLMPALAAFYFGLYVLLIVYLLVPVFLLASVYMKTVEEHLLTKTIPVTQLKDWDILSKDLVVGGRRVATRRNIEGVTPEQVAEIKELAKDGRIPKKIDIRWGIKYAPILFISLLLTVYVGNLLEALFTYLVNSH